MYVEPESMCVQRTSQRDKIYEETDFSCPVWLSEIWI